MSTMRTGDYVLQDIYKNIRSCVMCARYTYVVPSTQTEKKTQSSDNFSQYIKSESTEVQNLWSNGLDIIMCVHIFALYICN